MSVSPLPSPIFKTLKTDSHQGLLWSVLAAHMRRPGRFPGLTSVYLLKLVPASAATATPPPMHAYCPSPVWSPLLVLCPPRRVSICQFPLLPSPSPRCFSTQGELNSLLEDLAKKSAFQGAKEGGEDCRENQQLLCGQPEGQNWREDSASSEKVTACKGTDVVVKA